MNVHGSQFAGPSCCASYEKEQLRSSQDRLTFYLDGRILFERFCHGESAGIVFSQWADGFDESGTIQWNGMPRIKEWQEAMPHTITDIQEDGNALQFDGKRLRYCKVRTLTSDPAHGYGWLKCLLMRLNHKGRS